MLSDRFLKAPHLSMPLWVGHLGKQSSFRFPIVVHVPMEVPVVFCQVREHLRHKENAPFTNLHRPRLDA